MLRSLKDPRAKTKFVDNVFLDRIEVDSWLTTHDNFHFIQSKKLANQPKNKAIAAVTSSIHPDWWEVSKDKVLDPRDADIDVFRDLGPMGRKMIKPR